MSALVHLIVTLWATLLAALDFETSSSQYLVTTSTPITTTPFTAFSWCTNESTATSQTLFSLCDSSAANYWRVYRGNSPTIGLTVACDAASTAATAATSNTTTSGSRFSGAMVCTSATDRRVILNGSWAQSGTSTTSRTPASIDRIAAGALATAAPQQFFDGAMDNQAWWAAALDQTEVESLHAGASPYNVRRSSLVFWLPLLSADTSPVDVVGGLQTSGTVPTAVESAGWPRRQRAR